MTRRQEEIWRKKMLELESMMLDWAKRKPSEAAIHDGSWMMSAFKQGYWLGRSDEAKRRKKRGE